MASKLRLFTRRFFIYTNVIVALVFGLACLVPYLDPRNWWFISFLGLAFPFLLLAVIFFLLGWLMILRPRHALISFVALLLGYKSISVFLAFHQPHSFSYTRSPGTIRVLTWNVARFIELKRNTNKGSETRLKMLDLLKQQNADVLCLQEFHTSTNPAFYDNIRAVQDLGYPYYYFSFDQDGDQHYYSSAIFSRFPIIDSGRVRYPRPSLPDVLLHADIRVDQDTLRFYTTHLQSLQFNRHDYERIEKIKSAEDSLLANSKGILSKLKRGITYRSIQADIVHEVMGNSPHPYLLCADLNDVPNSYTYFTVRGDLQDAFLKKGTGVGRTFTSLSPTLRIDYILAAPRLDIRQFRRITRHYSDHFMLLADIALKK
ncbi:MAG: endonuclease/exonuclease/phosphatase family protein [Sphingobacteriales bacterium]|nr:endonuclease/exonuclease/phosphatase family protein [Sphingobacteriales bacterium]